MSDWQKRKDTLHRERKELVEKMRPGMMSKSQMMKGTDGFMTHDEQVAKYDRWRNANSDNMTRWHEINREFKKHGEEGKPMSLDVIRDSKSRGKNIKYE